MTRPAMATRLRVATKRVVRYVRQPHMAWWEFRVLRACEAFARRHPFLREGRAGAEPGPRVLILNLNAGHYRAQVTSLLAKGLELRGYTPMVLTYSWCSRAEAAHRAFGIDRVEYLDEYVTKAARTWAHEIPQ